jgi:TonB family protein
MKPIRPVITFFVLIFFSSIAFAENPKNEEENIYLAELKLCPIGQQKFIDVISKSRGEFASANNDLKRSFSRHQRKKRLKAIIGNKLSITKWIGEISSMSTAQNGNALLNVKLFGDETIELFNMNKNSISIETELFEKLMNLSVGDIINFSGHYLTSKKENDYIREESITEEESMTRPKFSFIFTDAELCKDCQSQRNDNNINEDVSLDTEDTVYVSYFAKIKRQIEQTWTYPIEAARRGFSGKLNIRFVVSMDGNLVRIQLVNKSGYEILDSAAIQAVKEAAPFEPFPIHIKKEKLSILGTFIYGDFIE